jgi:hypothetical protein
VDRLFKSLLPDLSANEFAPICKVFSVIAAKIRLDIPAIDISEVMDEVATLLDYSIATQGYVIKPAATTANYIDLSQIDFEALRAKFGKGNKTTEAQKLRGTIAQKLTRMVRLNRTRIDFLQEFQKMIDEYNSGASNIETTRDLGATDGRRLGYLTAPMSAITHYAPISSIEPWKSTGKMVINFAEPAREIAPLKLRKNGRVAPLYGLRYTNFEKLKKATSLDEAFYRSASDGVFWPMQLGKEFRFCTSSH